MDLLLGDVQLGGGGWLTVALVLLTGLIAALTLTAVLLRTFRLLRERRRERLAAAPRRSLLAFVADGGEEGAEELLAIGPRAWRAVEPTAVALLGKVRGEAHRALAEVFERRGVAGQAVARLRHSDPVHRARAAETLGNLGRRDAVEPICVLLEDSNPEVRVVAVRALSAIGDPSAAEPLLAALSQRRVPVDLVAYALSRGGVDAVTALHAALRQDEPWVRATALQALGLIGAIGSVGQITDLLGHERNPYVRRAAVTTLGRLGGRSALEPLRKLLDPARSTPLRAAAARSLGDVGGQGSAEALVALLADPEYHVAYQAAQALRRLGVPGRRLLERVAAEEFGTPGFGNRLECTVLEPGAPTHIATAAPVAHARQALALIALQAGPGGDLEPPPPVITGERR
jgi:HEAT repeat protein